MKVSAITVDDQKILCRPVVLKIAIEGKILLRIYNFCPAIAGLYIFQKNEYLHLLSYPTSDKLLLYGIH